MGVGERLHLSIVVLLVGETDSRTYSSTVWEFPF